MLTNLRSLVSFFLVVASFPAAAAMGSPAPPLDLEARTRCQSAIQSVYQRHRLDAGSGSRPTTISPEILKEKAEDGVLKSTALERLWGVTISDADLQLELERMATHSQSPDVLAELFAALGEDPTKAAECLARPLLADRRLRAEYARDERLHGELRSRALRERSAISSIEDLATTSGTFLEVEWRRGPGRSGEPGSIVLEPEVFDARVRELRASLGGRAGQLEVGRVSPVREDETHFWALAVVAFDDQLLRLATVEWPKRPFDSWWRETRRQVPFEAQASSYPFRLPRTSRGSCVDDSWRPTAQLLDPRYWHTAVWTGSEMIVFGGMSSVGTVYGDGSRYDPATDTWALLPTTGSPGPRQSHLAVWTGQEMVVWGGRADTSGGRYDPASDTWAPTSNTGAPAGRVNASAVWTGTEMIVWGGESAAGILNSGGRYDPASDTWTPLAPAPLAPRAYHSAVWTGSRMVVWGGYNVHIGQLYGDGARYDAASDSWTPVTALDAPSARTYHTAVWTGSEMVVWGGVNEPFYDLSGGRYDPVSDSWSPTTLANAPSLRWFHAAVWTGTEMIVQGGSFGVLSGGRYDPVADTWTATSPINSANNGQGITAVWTGTEMIVWGGLDDDFFFHNDGGRYDPQLDLWHPTGTMNVPAARGLHSATWTGSEMIVWGGFSSGVSKPGGRYDPATDSWQTVATLGAPYGRENATAVWTGAEAIFWGGEPDGLDLGSGGRYDPASDSWTLTSMLNAPTNRYGHTAVWTGNEMIVFGGIGTFSTDTTAKRYRPATDTWTDASIAGAPGARDHHAAVWTGTEMIIWGGFINDGITPTGGRYDPVADSWTATNVAQSPVTRMWPIGEWTGSEMLVWGGYDWLFFGDLGDGARYDPATDSWTPINLVGAPTPRVAQGVWTGSELLLWGGANDSSGGRYNPATDAWRPTTLVDAPPVRAGGRWSTVWTGSEMIIWGGIIDTQQGSRYCADPGNGIFSDGFESGDTGAWSLTLP